MRMVSEESSERPLGVAVTQRQSARAGVLVIEDEPAMRNMLRDVLETSGYQVWIAETGTQAKEMIREVRPDLVILDLMLPDADGLVLCAALKARANVPIIICSATNRRRDAVLALHLGADDFVAKPFDIYDLEARVEAVLRRSAQQKPARPVAEPDQYRVGELVIDRTRRHVVLGTSELQLTPTEYRLLCTLASRPDEVFSRDELAQHVWGYQDASSGRAIDVHIRRLRVKLDSVDIPPPPIISVRGFGYKISAGQSAQRGISSVA
jgi:two-component system response regulator MtrA